MMINRNNYEIHFIDYFEGNMDQTEKDELLHFLSGNPDLKGEFEEFKKHYTGISEGDYKFKDNLKKDIGDLGKVNDDTIDEYSIAYLENDLTNLERETLLEAVENNAQYARTFKLYQYTKLEPDESIIYKYKNRLKRFVLERKKVLRGIGYASAAAVLLMGILLINPEEGVQQTPQSTAEATVEEANPVKIEIVETNEIKVLEPKRPEIKTKPPKETVLANALKTEPETEQKNELAELEKLEPRTIRSISAEKTNQLAILHKPVRSNQLAQNTMQPIKTAQPETIARSNQKRGINLLNIAELGVKVFNTLNERNIELEPQYTINGQLKSVTVITEERKITAPAI